MGLRCSALIGLRVVRDGVLVPLWRASARRSSFLARRAGRRALPYYLYLQNSGGFKESGWDKAMWKDEICRPRTANPPFSAGSQSSSFLRAPETTT